MTPETDERILVRAASTGNKTAQGILYDRYFMYTVKVSNRFLKNWDNALDAAQEVFFLVFMKNKLCGFRNEVKLQTWLYAIARNVCFSRYRKQKRQAENSVLEPELPVTSFFCQLPVANPEECLLLEERQQRLRKLMLRLPPLYFKTIISSYFLEHSYCEGARNLGVTSSYYGLLKTRATKKLAEIMKQNIPAKSRLREVKAEAFSGF